MCVSATVTGIAAAVAGSKRTSAPIASGVVSPFQFAAFSHAPPVVTFVQTSLAAFGSSAIVAVTRFQPMYCAAVPVASAVTSPFSNVIA